MSNEDPRLKGRTNRNPAGSPVLGEVLRLPLEDDLKLKLATAALCILIEDRPALHFRGLKRLEYEFQDDGNIAIRLHRREGSIAQMVTKAAALAKQQQIEDESDPTTGEDV